MNDEHLLRADADGLFGDDFRYGLATIHQREVVHIDLPKQPSGRTAAECMELPIERIKRKKITDATARDANKFSIGNQEEMSKCFTEGQGNRGVLFTDRRSQMNLS